MGHHARADQAISQAAIEHSPTKPSTWQGPRSARLSPTISRTVHPIKLADSPACPAAVFALQVRNSSPGAGSWSARRRIAIITAEAIAHLLALAFSAILPVMAGFLFRLAAIVRQAYAAPAELVRLAAIRERARFARDLHDPLGRLGPARGGDHHAPAQHRTELLYIPLYTASRTRNIIRLDLTNDGVPRSAASHRERGGLGNLAGRLGTDQATLTTTLVGDGRFCLLATGARRPGGVLGRRRPGSRTRTVIPTAQF
jgi:hypothetical protein